MIFESLVMHNFGPYLGRQELLLSPPSEKKPITLIGGLNGGGKTTILDAIQLALHGKRASGALRSGLSYSEYLRKAIHRSVEPTEGAAIELELTVLLAGREERVMVRRSWRSHSASVREQLAVYREGEFDQGLTEAWADHAEVLLPSGIAPLFLFDGEQIERLADPGTSAEMLASSVHTLLGLDLVERLDLDLARVEKRNRGDASTEEANDLEEVTAALKLTAMRRSEVAQEAASTRNERTTAQKAFRKAEQLYQSEGGELYEQRAALEQERATLDRSVQGTESKLRDLASGPLPLLCMPKLLARVARRHELEESSVRSAIVVELLKGRDEALIGALRSVAPESEVIQEAERYLAEDRVKRASEGRCETHLDLGTRPASQLRDLCGLLGRTYVSEVTELLSELQRLERRRAELEVTISRLPADGHIEGVRRQVDDARVRLLDVERRIESYEGELEELGRKTKRLEEQRLRLLKRDLEIRFKAEDSERVVTHSRRARATLARFRKALLARNLERLGNYVSESYSSLLRKKNLVRSVTIDPDSFEVVLHGRSDTPIGSEKLSAGERQLLATALLWGLARASGHTLPMVIDTPLGRLDSVHRDRLVRKYFPHASHQVILLSTDEEIDTRYYERLSRHIGRTYTLEYDDSTHSSSPRAGYFTRAAA